MAAPAPSPASPLHGPALHESAERHVTGEALYVDDLPAPPRMLHAQVVTSPVAHGRIRRLDLERARQAPGVLAVFSAADIPGENNVGPVVHDEPVLAVDGLHFHGQSVALVVGDSPASCRRGAGLVDLEVEPLPALLSMDAAIEAGSFLGAPHEISRGEVDGALAFAPLRFSGEVRSGAQDHFYLETQVSLAVPEEGAALKVYCSTQHPTEVQHLVAAALGWGSHQVTVEVPRMGGGFGGKETQAAPFAVLAGLAAVKLGRPVKLWLNRDQDMAQTGKRHPFLARFDAGFDHEGHLLALDARLYSDGGWATDLSRAIMDRALFHLDNAYYVPACRFVGQVCRTNLPSNTAFRGFGGPQGMLVMEEVLNRAAERLGLDPAEVRARNFYADAPRHETPYGQVVTDNRLPRLRTELLAESRYAERRAAIDAWNRASTHLKRGIGFQPVKFGISFTTSFLNQAAALVLMYADGSVQLSHGGTEMGQGLHTKMRVLCEHELGVTADRVRVMNTATDKVPNTSATAASSGADLNGQAVVEACTSLRERLRPVAAQLLEVPAEAAAEVQFRGNAAHARGRSVAFSQLARAAYLRQVPLSATGFYRTPGIHYDPKLGRGKPFHYFAYGAAVVEVELSGLTGEHRVTAVDILHDAGRSLVPNLDRGQVEGAFIQGLGWLTAEEVLFSADGKLVTHSPDTYKIPSLGDAPEQFRVRLLENAAQDGVVHGSKAVGEPPFMLALGVVTALRHAVAAFGQPGREVQLGIPCTPESVLRAVVAARVR
jgi:xanthine dehydrogenase large subunit